MYLSDIIYGLRNYNIQKTHALLVITYESNCVVTGFLNPGFEGAGYQILDHEDSGFQYTLKVLVKNLHDLAYINLIINDIEANLTMFRIIDSVDIFFYCDSNPGIYTRKCTVDINGFITNDFYLCDNHEIFGPPPIPFMEDDKIKKAREALDILGALLNDDSAIVQDLIRDQILDLCDQHNIKK